MRKGDRAGTVEVVHWGFNAGYTWEMVLLGRQFIPSVNGFLRVYGVRVIHTVCG